MKLLSPSSFAIEMAKIQHHERREPFMLDVRRRPPPPRIRKYLCCLPFGTWIGVTVGQSVIGKATSGVMELLVPMVQGFEEPREARNL